MNVTVVVGGQAGSEGKGAVCGHLHKSVQYEIAVRVGGSNAGHSIVDEAGKKWAFRHLPVATVIDPNCELVLAGGSEIDVDVLRGEIEAVEKAGYSVEGRLWIDKEATFVTILDKEWEQDIATGTTGKGVGGARARRMLRRADLMRHMTALGDKWRLCDTAKMLRPWDCGSVLIEGTQGYQLGSHAGQYPYVTSGDCRAIDFMAQAGIAPMDADVWVVLRTYPIRIAGNSGPLKEEISWGTVGSEEGGVPDEITTVTKKVRRVGTWDWDWAIESVEANCGQMPVKVALTMVDYDYPELKGVEGIRVRSELPKGLRDFMLELEDRIGHAGQVRALGTSDRTMIDLVG